MSFQGRTYHDLCLVCTKCQSPLTDKVFRIDEQVSFSFLICFGLPVALRIGPFVPTVIWEEVPGEILLFGEFNLTLICRKVRWLSQISRCWCVRDGWQAQVARGLFQCEKSEKTLRFFGNTVLISALAARRISEANPTQTSMAPFAALIVSTRNESFRKSKLVCGLLGLCL